MNEADKDFAEMRKNPETTRKNRKWPFSQMKVGNNIKIDNKKDYMPAIAAMQQVQRRKSWTFLAKWYEEKGYGVIGRSA